MGTVRSHDWLVSITSKFKPDIDDGFVELFHGKNLLMNINENTNNVQL